MCDQNKFMQYELDREAQIAKNKRAMQELQQAADALKQAIDQDKAASQPAKKPRVPKQPKLKVVEDPDEIRRSERVLNRPAVNYAVDVVERIPRSPGKGKIRVRRGCGGLVAVVDIKKDPVAAWQAAPAGWKEALGCPSDEAAAEAFAAGRAFAAELEGKGRKAFPKHMSKSQVAGGFWCSIPKGLLNYYNGGKRTVMMISHDQEDRTPDSFVKDNNLDNSVCWEVVFLNREGAGWSGGWRAFAIDHMLTPNDTVVFEVMDNAEGEAEVTAAKAKAAADAAAAAAAAAAAGPSTGAEGEAKDGEDGGSDLAEGAAAAAEGGAEGRGSDEGPASSGASCEAGEKEQETDGDKAGSSTYAAAAAAGGGAPAAAAAAAKAAGGKSKGKYSDSPARRMYVKAHIIRASAYETEETKQKQAAEAAAAGAAAAAEGAEAAAEGAEAAAAAAAAVAADGAVRATRKRKTSGPDSKAGAQQAPAAAAGATGAGGRPKRARQQEQQPAGGPKKAKTAPAAAAAGKSKAKQGAAASNGKASGKAALVRQPANGKVMVAPPTDDEIRRNDSTDTDFVVENIMDHKVDGKGQDLFLIRWEDFGPYWDSWEPRENLTKAPNSYTWQGGKAAIPKKFQRK